MATPRFSIARSTELGGPRRETLASATRARMESARVRLASKKARPSSESRQPAPVMLVGNRRVADFLEQRQRRINHARAWRIAAPDPLFERLNDLVAIARLFREQRHHHQTKIAVLENAFAVTRTKAAAKAMAVTFTPAAPEIVACGVRRLAAMFVVKTLSLS